MAAASSSDLTRAHEWLVKFQAAADALDAKLWITTFFRPDATVNFAGNCPLIGHEEIIASMGAALGGLEKMKHVIGHVDVTPERIYQEATISYLIKGDPKKEEFVIKGFAVVHKRVDEDVARRMDVYGDFSAVFARMAEVRSGSQGAQEHN